MYQVLKPMLPTTTRHLHDKVTVVALVLRSRCVPTPFRSHSIELLRRKKWNEINGVLGHLCAHVNPGQENLLGMVRWMRWHYSPCRHWIRNSSPVGGLGSSTIPLGHRGSPQYWIFTRERGRNISLFETWRPKWDSNPRSSTSQLQAALTTAATEAQL